MRGLTTILCCVLLLVVGWSFTTDATTQLIPLDLTYEISAPAPPPAIQTPTRQDDMLVIADGGCRGGICPLPPNNAKAAPEAAAEREGRRLGAVVRAPVRALATIKPVRRVVGLLKRR